MGRRRPVRQLGDQRTVIETVPHVRQIELADAKFTGPGEDSVEVRVGRMRLAREAVGDPHVHAFVQRGHFVAHLAEIDGISDRASAFVEAHAHRGRTAVRLIDETDLRLAEGPVRAELVPFQDGPIEIGSGKGISEALFQARKGLAVGMQRHCVAQRRGDRPQVVETGATNAAVSATNAGSHFWPRCGTGARNGESVSTSIWSAGSHLAVSWRSWAFLNVTIPLSDT